MNTPPDLQLLRKEIDRIDHALLALLAERVQLLHAILQYKEERNLPLQDPEREASLLQQRAQQGEALGLESQAVHAMFRAILDASLEVLQRSRVGKSTRQ